MNYSDNKLYVIDGDLALLKKRLHEREVVNARIDHKLTNKKYLICLFGYIMVVQSDVKFYRFEEIEVTVRRVYPKLVLGVLQFQQRSCYIELTEGQGSFKTDLMIN